jgi:hypothetical protein
MILTVASPLPPGMFPTVLKNFEETTHPEFGEGILIRFEITGGQHAGQVSGVTISTESPPSPTNKAGRILAGLLGRALTPGEKVDLSQFVGKPYNVILETNKKGTGTAITAVTNPTPF